MGEEQLVWFNAELDLTLEAVENVRSFFWANEAVGVVTIDNEALPPGMDRLPEGTARMTVSFSAEEKDKAVFQKRLIREWKAASITMGFSAPLRFTDLNPDGWQDKWKEFFHPLRIGKHLLVQPTWEEADILPDDVVLTIDPGMAFGTGGHETTSMCMELLESLSETVNRDLPLLDLGCGSGILAMTAYKLGFSSLEATDIDPEAIRVSLENFQLNGIPEGAIPVSTKSLDDLTDSFELIVANILAGTLIDLAPQIVAKLSPTGQLVLSGILQSQGQEVRHVYETLGFSLKDSLVRGEWVALLMQREDPKPSAQ